MHEKVVLRDEKGIWYFRELKDGTLEIIEYRGEENVVIVPDRIGDKCVSRIGRECFSAKKAMRESLLCQTMAQIRCVAIPSTVKSIGKRAFSHCRGLWCVAIQEGLVSVDDEAFAYCDNLERIILPESVTSIGQRAFAHCAMLGRIRIPEKVTAIQEDTFLDCEELESAFLPLGIESIGARAFCDCGKLWLIDFPESLKVIGQRAFEDCARLRNVTIPDSVEVIGDAAFRGCSGLAGEYGFVIVKNILFDCFGERANVLVPDGVRVIGTHAFSGCSDMESIVIADSVSEIQNGAFSGCRNLRYVLIPDSVKQIGDWAFRGCESIRHAAISKQVTTINFGLFDGCRNLQRIVIPDGVTTIKQQAFYDCDGLTGIYIPESVKDPCRLFSDRRSEDLVISAPSGSDAQWYAKKIGVAFKCADMPTGWLAYAEVMAVPIHEMDLSLRAFNCLKRAGIYTVGDLLEYCSADIIGEAWRISVDRLMKIRNMGRKSLDEILGKMKKLGLNVPTLSEIEAERIEVRKQLPIDELDFSYRVSELLKRRNIHTVADLVQYTEEDLRKFIGRNRLEEIKKKMAMFGLELQTAPADMGPDGTADGVEKKSLEEVAKKLESMGLLLREET